MRQIPLTQGKVALVDATNYEWLNQWRWHVKQDGHTFYAARNITVAKNKRRIERMHRLILRLQPGNEQQCDHRDGNGLNNQISNLRVCTRAQNQHSQRNQRGGTSKYKGVHWSHRENKWCSKIQLNRKQIHLGYFGSEVKAARAHDVAALKYHREFALTNKMLGLL